MTVNTIRPSELGVRHRSGEPIELIDVRTPMEYDELHAEPARLVPLQGLEPTQFMAGRTLPADQPLYVICQSGGRSRQACEAFAAAGFSNVVNVEGGTRAWAAANLPVVRGRQRVSLERQVRIAAGSLVLLGIGLGFFVHPGLFGLSAFVGAGLVFSGITDTCGMALMLARMPWNRTGR